MLTVMEEEMHGPDFTLCKKQYDPSADGGRRPKSSSLSTRMSKMNEMLSLSLQIASSGLGFGFGVRSSGVLDNSGQCAPWWLWHPQLICWPCRQTDLGQNEIDDFVRFGFDVVDDVCFL